MGQRGPAPQPIALRILKGEDHKDRLNRAPRDQDPPPKPEGLSTEAARVWDRILGCTTHIGQPHADTFKAYCEATSALNAMNPKGTKEWRDLVNIHRQLARELCLTPATGGNLTGKARVEEPKLAKYLKPA